MNIYHTLRYTTSGNSTNLHIINKAIPNQQAIFLCPCSPKTTALRKSHRPNKQLGNRLYSASVGSLFVQIPRDCFGDSYIP